MRTKDRLKEASLQLLLEGKDISVAALSAMVNIAPASIYHHYSGGLEELIDSSMLTAYESGLRDSIDEAIRALSPGPGSPKGVRPALRLIAENAMHPKNDPHRIARLAVLAHYKSRPKLAVRLRIAQKELIDDLATALLPWIGERAREVAALSMVALAGSPIAIINPSEQDREIFIEAVMSLFPPDIFSAAEERFNDLEAGESQKGL